jgi:fructose-1,6-bisphosphatase/inositol monophosphatase family enzyme
LPAIEADGAAEISARAAAQLNAAVREAGSLALSMFGKPIKQWTKGPSSSPVCEADIAVDALLRERLTGGGNAFAWLSEETADDAARLTARYVWVVDPIDGTRAYIAGQSDWAISAALIEQGRQHAERLCDSGESWSGSTWASHRRAAEIFGALEFGLAAVYETAAGPFAGAAARARRTRRLRCRFCRRQQPRLGPCGGRSFGARSGRRDHAASGRNNRL